MPQPAGYQQPAARPTPAARNDPVGRVTAAARPDDMPAQPRIRPRAAPFRRRASIVAFVAAAALLAWAAAACGSGDARLLAADYAVDRTALNLVDPLDLDEPGERLAVIEHAAGWPPTGRVRPDGRAVALLVLPRGRSDERTGATIELLSEDSRVRIADGLDVHGGVVWSDDADHLLARAESGPGHRLLVLDGRTGELRAGHAGASGLSLYPVAMIGAGVWAAEISADGSVLAEFELRGGELVRLRSFRLADGITRDWAVSPDGAAVAYGLQLGSEPAVALKSLGGAPAGAALHGGGEISEGEPLADAAMPVWLSAGELALARWPGRDGFTVPIAADAGSGRLAVRLLSGSGPGDPGDERAAVVHPDGSRTSASDPARRIIGWWN